MVFHLLNTPSSYKLTRPKELVEVDLETLSVVSREKFPFSIAAISEAKHTTPITVGTNLSLHLYDPRSKSSISAISNAPERLDEATPLPRASNFQTLFNPQPTNYAPLFHPGPLSIIHISTSGDNWDGNGEIYVAGRFPSILNYDRRYFPKLRGTIHSGARLCSMTSMPYPFAAQLKDKMRRAELSMEQVESAKALPGNTLIACGEYNSKGSLELYGLSPLPHFTTMTSNSFAGRAQNSDFLKNRQTSSNSKLLSVSSHGTRIVFSDGGGNIKWVERDGFTEVRNWNIGRGSTDGPRGIFGTVGDSYLGSASGDIVRKILHTQSCKGQSGSSIDQDNLVLWTGEKVGLLTFSKKPAFDAESFELKAKTAEEAVREREERMYGQTMRMALERQADEVRFVRGLGLGLG
jgi:hypothetical protein